MLQQKQRIPTKCIPLQKRPAPSKQHLFAPGRKLIVQRASILGGNALHKPFQRPMVKRRAYGKSADLELRKASLGPKRRMNGMARLLARAGKGLQYKAPHQQRREEDDSDRSDDDEEQEKQQPDRPYDPLIVWKSPHTTTTSEDNSTPPRGLPPRTVQERQADAYGVETLVTVLKPAPLTAYAKQDVVVPTVLGKWLRPHQREGVKFMYECVMGLKDFDGRGCILADGTCLFVCLFVYVPARPVLLFHAMLGWMNE